MVIALEPARSKPGVWVLREREGKRVQAGWVQASPDCCFASTYGELEVYLIDCPNTFVDSVKDYIMQFP